MNIDRINKAMSNGLVGVKKLQKKTKSKKTGKNRTNSSVRSRIETIINEAIESDQVNPAMVAKARELLDSGELDSMKNVEATVKKILKYGF